MSCNRALEERQFLENRFFLTWASAYVAVCQFFLVSYKQNKCEKSIHVVMLAWLFWTNPSHNFWFSQCHRVRSLSSKGRISQPFIMLQWTSQKLSYLWHFVLPNVQDFLFLVELGLIEPNKKWAKEIVSSTLHTFTHTLRKTKLIYGTLTPRFLWLFSWS